MAASDQTDHSSHFGQFTQQEKQVAQALCEFRDVVRAVKGLRCPLDDAYLLIFLRAKKLDVAQSAKLIINLYKLRKEHANIFLSISPYELESEFRKNSLIIVLKNRDSLGRKIVVFRTGLWDPSDIGFDRLIMCISYVLQEVIVSEETQENGIVCIGDYTALNFNQSRKILCEFTLQRIRLLLKYVQGSFPVRFKEIHVVDKYFICKLIYSISKPFLSEKMKQRIYIHSNMTFLHKVVDPGILPEWLGGSLSDNDATDQELMKSLFSKAAYYTEMSSYGFCDDEVKLDSIIE